MPQGIYVFLSSVSELFLDLGLLGLAPPLGQVFGGGTHGVEWCFRTQGRWRPPLTTTGLLEVLERNVRAFFLEINGPSQNCTGWPRVACTWGYFAGAHRCTCEVNYGQFWTW